MSFGTLNSLKSLYLSYNKVFALSVLHFNFQLTDLPLRLADLKQLQLLHLSGNPFTRFPLAICAITTLKTLYMSQCKLAFIPSEICKLSSLETLDLSMNLLTDVPTYCLFVLYLAF